MNTSSKMAILVIGLLVLIAPNFAVAQTSVNCTRGQSVQIALDRASGPRIINVTGTCTENLVIKKDDITLQGGTYLPADPTQSTILIQGARRVVITGVTVTGGRNGIAVYQGGSLTLEGNSVISGATSTGVVAVFGSSANVNLSTISGNQYGVNATDNSALVLTNSLIQENASTGVLVLNSSSARIGQDILGVPGPNTITNNHGTAVSISRSSNALIDGNQITYTLGDGNSGSGISIQGSYATVTNNTVSGFYKGISVDNGGSARIGITDVDTRGSNTVTGNSLEGIQISNGGTAYIYWNTIQNNGTGEGRAGVAIYRATGRLLGRNNISNNAGHGVVVELGALFQGTGDFNLPSGFTERDNISQNGYSGISGWNGARLDIRQLNVTNNTQNGISLGLRSSLRIYDGTISGSPNGIAIWEGSAVSFSHPASDSAASVTSNTTGVNCGGAEASIIGDTAGVSGNSLDISLNCTGF